MTWANVLPVEYRDKQVAVLLLPATSVTKRVTAKDHEVNIEAVISELTDKSGQKRHIGLFIVTPETESPQEQAAIFHKMGIRMADPQYIGHVNDVPDALLNRPDLKPIMLTIEGYGDNVLDLRAHFQGDKKNVN